MTDAAKTARDAYLKLVQDIVLGAFAPRNTLLPVPPAASFRRQLADRALAARGMQLATYDTHVEDVASVEEGRIAPRYALSMAGRPRLDNVRACIERVLADDVPGDVIETGVWRGGATIYMRAVLKAWNATDRRVWVADSFQGLPVPDPENYPADAEAFPWHEHNDVLGVAVETVRANFASLHLLDDQVVFLEGLFKDTLPPLVDEEWSVIRLDGDLYESTVQALQGLYPNLSPRGWVLIDDYGDVAACKQAVTDYRGDHGITDPIQSVDHTGIFWQKAS